MKRVLSLLFLALLVSLGSMVWLKWHRMKHFEQSLNEKNRLLKQENRGLLSEINHFKDTGFIEHYIREELGYLKNGELTYELRGNFEGSP